MSEAVISIFYFEDSLHDIGVTSNFYFEHFSNPRFKVSQLAHDVVTTLGFGCTLVATLDNVLTPLLQRCVSDVVTDVVTNDVKTNVVTTLCFRRRFPDLVLTLKQRRDSDVSFLMKI